MHSLLYLLWFLLPCVFFLLALWIKLERVGSKNKKDNPKDLFHQGLFILGCVLVSVVIDQTVLQSLVEATVGDTLPLGFYQFFLLPLILLIGAKIVGPSQKILIPYDQKKIVKRRK
jgi:hypothetical protein